MKIETSHLEIADICLSADGGHCQSCADDVAEAFGKRFKEVNLEKLREIIDKKMKEYYDRP